MNAIDSLSNIRQTALVNVDCKYCLLKGMDKIPYTYEGKNARPNINEDFVDIDTIANAKNLSDYACLGISVKASNIIAIDVDHCFHTSFDITSGDERAKDIIQRFQNLPVYIEFSFSGRGLRIILKQKKLIEDYNLKYYIKNSNCGIEYYQPNGGARYVSITGRYISNKELDENIDLNSVLTEFLEKYMVRPKRTKKEAISPTIETRTFEQLKRKVKMACFNNLYFQDDYMGTAPGSGKDESERDFRIILYLYENITRDKELVKALFEDSHHYKTKDWKHIKKWEFDNFRYFEFIWSQIVK